MRIILTVLAIATGLWAEQHSPGPWPATPPAGVVQPIPASLSGDAVPVTCPAFWDV